jgi:hypothetical protein
MDERTLQDLDVLSAEVFELAPADHESVESLTTGHGFSEFGASTPTTTST